MNPNPGVENLLRNVLADVLPPTHEAGLLATTLGEVARQRRRRTLQKRGALGVATAVLATLALLPWTRSPAPVSLSIPSPAPRTAAAANAVPVIASQPLPAPFVVETRLGLTPMVASGRTDLGWVETGDGTQHATVLSDDDLLSLLAGKPAALVRNDGETRLVLVGGSEVMGRP